jgi:hypothetical protein
VALEERAVDPQRDDRLLAEVEVLLDVEVHHPRRHSGRHDQDGDLADADLSGRLKTVLSVDHEMASTAVLDRDQRHEEADALDRGREVRDVGQARLALVADHLEPVYGQRHGGEAPDPGEPLERLHAGIRLGECADLSTLAIGSARASMRQRQSLTIACCRRGSSSEAKPLSAGPGPEVVDFPTDAAIGKDGMNAVLECGGEAHQGHAVTEQRAQIADFSWGDPGLRQEIGAQEVGERASVDLVVLEPGRRDRLARLGVSEVGLETSHRAARRAIPIRTWPQRRRVFPTPAFLAGTTAQPGRWAIAVKDLRAIILHDRHLVLLRWTSNPT